MASSDDEMRVYAETKCEVLLVAFAALGGGAGGVGRKEFVGSSKRAGMTHSLFLSDVKSSWFLLGEGGFGAVVQTIIREAVELKPKRIVLVGASMGGYAAARAALELLALRPQPEELASILIRVLAFGPQIVIDPEERAGMALPPMPFDPNLATLKHVWTAQKRVGGLPSALCAGTTTVADGTESARAHIDVHVGALSSGDLQEAQLLQEWAEDKDADNRLMTVAIHSHPNLGHALASELRDEGELEPLLRRAAGLEGGDADADAGASASPDLAHFKDVVAMLKDRWANLPAESREKLDHLNDPSNAQRDEAMQEFKETWAGAAEKDTGRLASVDQFNSFANKHLANIRRRIGWAPNLSSEDNAIIFEAIQALDTATEGIDLKGYGRYHACLKTVV